MIWSKTTVQAALARAEKRGAPDIEHACIAVANELAISVETVREVAYALAQATDSLVDLTDAQVQGADSMAATL